MTDLEERLRSRLEGGSKLLVPYLTCGIPSPQRFVALVEELSGHADALEVGIPFSDPMMDGPVIQEASRRALDLNVTPKTCASMISEARRHAPRLPIVVMTYFNPVHRMGLVPFASKMRDAGVSGLVVPDLPLEESAELGKVLARRDIALIQMVAPSTPPKRAAKIAAASEGFVYGVARLGVTGVQEGLADGAAEIVQGLRTHTSLPILLGIGISNSETARVAAQSADGVIVGSALMEHILAGDESEAIRLAASISQALGRRTLN